MTALAEWLASAGIPGELLLAGAAEHWVFGPGAQGDGVLHAGPLELRGELARLVAEEPWARWAVEGWGRAIEFIRARDEARRGAVLTQLALEFAALADVGDSEALAAALAPKLEELLGADAFTLYLPVGEGLEQALGAPVGQPSVGVRIVDENGQTVLGEEDAPALPLGITEEQDLWRCCVATRGIDGRATAALTISRRASLGPWPLGTVESLSLVASLVAPLARAVRALEMSRALAARDALTGLATRRHFLDELQREMARGRRDRQPLTLLAIDVDHFKRVNDTWGHAAGDAVLRAIVEVLRRGTRACDCVGRLGGDEFVALLPSTDLQVGTQVATRLCESLHGMRVSWRRERLAISVSIGAACWDGSASAEDLLERADQALYSAKDAGRAQVSSRSGRLHTLVLDTVPDID